MAFDDVIDRLRTKDEWFVLNQDSERLGIATPSQIVEFVNGREPWAYSDWFIFDRANTECFGLTHDNEWVVMKV